MVSLSAREVAYQKLRSRIIALELRPGDPLNDRLLAEEMGISRTPVREALIMLNIAHMVTIKPQSGTHVAPIDLKLMALEQYARFTLEKEMLNQACGRLTPEHVAAYRENLEAYAVCAGQDTPDRFTRLLALDNAFHRIAFEVNGMEEHFDHMLSTFQHIERLRMFSLITGESKAYVREDHGLILQAVLEKDPAMLERVLATHLQRYKLSVEKAKKTNPEYFIDR